MEQVKVEVGRSHNHYLEAGSTDYFEVVVVVVVVVLQFTVQPRLHSHQYRKLASVNAS